VAERQVAKGAAPLPSALAFRTAPSDDGTTVAAALRLRLPGQSWSAVRRLVETGKVRVNGERVVDPAARLGADAEIALDVTAKRLRPTVPGFSIVHEDPHLIIIEKPAGVSSVPFHDKETNTAMDLIRADWRAAGRPATRQPLYIVHRLDKETSGLLCFAKTRAGERGLHEIFQRHRASRFYLAVAEGDVAAGRIESRLVQDRGDGLRGSTRDPHDRQAQHAVTHIEVLERLRGATLCRVRLETGRTHQIRIHLSEAGTPIVGDPVYCRDLLRAERRPLPAERMLLHAAHLGFEHPVGGQRLDFDAPPPPEFQRAVEALRVQPAPRPRVPPGERRG
jgi:23S rRNA pseudouridine1911/1915/1917 synthase